MQLDAILILSCLWARELGQKDGYFEAFEISPQWVDASFFAAIANSSNHQAIKKNLIT
jgi:hypothetical protein